MASMSIGVAFSQGRIVLTDLSGGNLVRRLRTLILKVSHGIMRRAKCCSVSDLSIWYEQRVTDQRSWGPITSSAALISHTPLAIPTIQADPDKREYQSIRNNSTLNALGY